MILKKSSLWNLISWYLSISQCLPIGFLEAAILKLGISQKLNQRDWLKAVQMWNDWQEVTSSYIMFMQYVRLYYFNHRWNRMKENISNRLGFNYYVRLYSSLVEIYQEISKMVMSKWWYMWSGTICTILRMWKTPKSECYF